MPPMKRKRLRMAASRSPRKRWYIAAAEGVRALLARRPEPSAGRCTGAV